MIISLYIRKIKKGCDCIPFTLASLTCSSSCCRRRTGRTRWEWEIRGRSCWCNRIRRSRYRRNRIRSCL